MTRIGIDASGGDNGCIEVLKAVNYYKHSDIDFTLIGDEDEIKSHISDENILLSNNIHIVDAKEKITMNDHPVFALRSKPNSSIFIAGKLLVEDKIDIFISAGNTGALVALAQFYLKPLKGIDRPVVATIVPTCKEPVIVIDSGCNVDSKPEWLYQYSNLGSEYYKLMFDKPNPRVGLLSVGVEENKGNNLTISTYKLLTNNNNINFVGNVEARDIPFSVCDVLVTDGFSGNVFLKTYEGVAKLLLDIIKKAFMKTPLSMIGAMLVKGNLKDAFEKYDAKKYGGAPILGAKHLILKCHGNATESEYKNAIKQGEKLVWILKKQKR